MNREILIDALEGLDTGLIERYFEIKEKLIKKRTVIKSVMRWTVSAACIALIACVVIPIAMRISQLPDPPVVETTSGDEEDTILTPEDTTTQEPIIVEPPTYDPSDAYYENYYRENAGSSSWFTDWNGMFVSTVLERMLDSYLDKSRMYAINVFRHNDEVPHNASAYTIGVNDYIYEGKTYQDLKDEYEKLQKQYGNMSEEFQEEKDALWSEMNLLLDKQKELIESYFCRHEQADIAYFQGLGYITGEINGKLYIIITYDQFMILSKNPDMRQFGFTALTREDFLDIYPNAIYPK